LLRHARRLVAPLTVACLPFVPMATQAACGQVEHSPPPPAPAPVVIGVSLGLTGALNSFSAPLQNAARVAEGQINALGGVLGRPVQLKIVDDTSDEGAVAQKAVQSLLDAGAVAVIGPAGSSQVKATHQLTYDKHVLMISMSATSPELTTFEPAHDRYFFRTTPPDDLQGKAVVTFALRGPPGSTGGAPDAGPPGDGGAEGGVVDSGPKPLNQFCTKMALVNIDNSYGTAMGDVIAQHYPTKGGTITTRIKVATKVAASYTNEVNQLIASNPECMAIIAYDDVGDQFMTDLVKQRTSLPQNFIVIGTDGVYTSGFITNGRVDKTNPNSPTVAEGVYGTNPDTNPPTTQFNDFKNLFNAYYPLQSGAEPDAYTANTYDAIILAYLAMVQAGTVTDGVKVRDALYDVSKGGTAYGPAQLADVVQAIQNGNDIDYNGASGNVDLDDNGNTVSDYIVWRVVNGKYADPPIDRIKASDLQ
jgi:neutral amino acid transport system substrate-binding protein